MSLSSRAEDLIERVVFSLMAAFIIFCLCMIAWAATDDGPDHRAEQVRQCIAAGGTPHYTVDKYGDIATFLVCER